LIQSTHFATIIYNFVRSLQILLVRTLPEFAPEYSQNTLQSTHFFNFFIAGFTAWSSVREPTQVFSLLETVYHAFDEIARSRRVFKVETVGDCYVAVAGLPEARKDHAVVMARFARDCLHRMNDLTKKLELTLGPDTGDLSMRIGLHSGPVTAGVLRGDKSRFQLFGDTVNTASKIESSGSRNRIHLSTETASLLEAAGKGHWLRKREDVIRTKVKGDMQTFWLEVKAPSIAPTGSSASDGQTEESISPFEAKNLEQAKAAKKEEKAKSKTDMDEDKLRRLVDWNSDVLARLLRQIVAHRNAIKKLRGTVSSSTPATLEIKSGGTVIDEVKEIIELPEYDPLAAQYQEDPQSIDLGEAAQKQLRDYVMLVATFYRDNPFHNFEHASHVTMSVVKLLSRIIAPDVNSKNANNQDHAATLHDHTYGITSDPLTQFACVFAALIHDTDHSGVPNAQLVKEGAEVAKIYDGKSVAEQNSVDIAWDLLMHKNYKDLRNLICETDEEMRHFRELVVNSVMATDIVDKELKALRNARWEKAFAEENQVDSRENNNRKATIVIEHLIQASDIAHTMQHWHIYRKWNERLFHEMYDAWRNGRSEKDPSEFWYNGEIGFFDFYIIPLAKKLKECGVFGVSSDEYLNYAQKNRAEWEAQGHQVVEKLVEKYTAEYANHQVRLDDIQDADNVPLRSRMFRSDTLSDDEGFLAEVEKQINDEDGDLSEKSQEDLVARASSRLTRGASKEKL
jgi:class 3 adenylate cyclase